MMRVSETARANCSRFVGEARRQHADYRRREYQGQEQEDRFSGEQERKDAIGEQPRGVDAVLLADAGVSRHEGGIERALGKNGAEMIRQPERDKERIGDRAGAENGRQHDIAHKAGNARQKCEAADREKASEHAAITFLLDESVWRRRRARQFRPRPPAAPPR